MISTETDLRYFKRLKKVRGDKSDLYYKIFLLVGNLFIIFSFLPPVKRYLSIVAFSVLRSNIRLVS